MFDFIDLISTPTCISCGVIGRHVCLSCILALNSKIRTNVHGVSSISVAAYYEGWLRSKIIEYKSGNRTLALPLAHVLLEKCAWPHDLPLIVMPSTSEKIRHRGFSTTGLLAKKVEQLLGRHDLVIDPITLIRPVADQVGLNRSDRARNVMRSQKSSYLISGSVVLLDDVITTGASMAELARACRAAGANPQQGLALCGSQL